MVKTGKDVRVAVGAGTARFKDQIGSRQKAGVLAFHRLRFGKHNEVNAGDIRHTVLVLGVRDRETYVQPQLLGVTCS